MCVSAQNHVLALFVPSAGDTERKKQPLKVTLFQYVQRFFFFELFLFKMSFIILKFYLLFYFIFIRVQLIYTIVSISAVQHSDPVICICTHTHTFFFSYYLPSCSIPRNWIQFPLLLRRKLCDSRSSQKREYLILVSDYFSMGM